MTDTDSRLTALEAAVRALCSPHHVPSAEVLALLDAARATPIAEIAIPPEQTAPAAAEMARCEAQFNNGAGGDGYPCCLARAHVGKHQDAYWLYWLDCESVRPAAPKAEVGP